MANMLLGIATNVLEWTGFILQWTVSKLKYTVIKLSILTGIVLFLLWLSTLVYATFYYMYMPYASHLSRVYFQFNVCDNGIGMCSFPVANVSFGQDGIREEILRSGQKYRILVDLEVPESLVNQELGMFMVILKMYDREGRVTSHSARSAVLRFESVLFKTIKTMVFSPFLLAGLTEEKQHLEVEMYPSYIDDYNNPSVGAIIELQSQKIQVYSAKLNMYACFTGLRYYLFYWPVTSAVIGVLINFIFCCIIAILSYLKYFQEDDVEDIDPMLFNRRYSLFDRRVRIQAQLDQEREDAEISDESDKGSNSEELSEADRMNIQPETVGIVVTDVDTDIQEESLHTLGAEGEETILKSGDVTLLSATSSPLRQRRASHVQFDLPN